MKLYVNRQVRLLTKMHSGVARWSHPWLLLSNDVRPKFWSPQRHNDNIVSETIVPIRTNLSSESFTPSITNQYKDGWFELSFSEVMKQRLRNFMDMISLPNARNENCHGLADALLGVNENYSWDMYGDPRMHPVVSVKLRPPQDIPLFEKVNDDVENIGKNRDGIIILDKKDIGRHIGLESPIGQWDHSLIYMGQAPMYSHPSTHCLESCDIFLSKWGCDGSIVVQTPFQIIDYDTRWKFITPLHAFKLLDIYKQDEKMGKL